MKFYRMMAVLTCGVLVGAAVVGPDVALSAGDTISPEEKKIFEEKCSPCHSTSRILGVAPGKVRETIATMEAKNPAFFEDVGGDRLTEIAARMLNDPRIIEQRKALEEAVGKGKALFSDPSLGRNGKSCADCHTEDSVRGVADAFPKFVEKAGRLMSLYDTVNLMISSNMKGKILPLGDERITALEAYLKSLR